jgi:hypothetical protein
VCRCRYNRRRRDLFWRGQPSRRHATERATRAQRVK